MAEAKTEQKKEAAPKKEEVKKEAPRQQGPERPPRRQEYPRRIIRWGVAHIYSSYNNSEEKTDNIDK